MFETVHTVTDYYDGPRRGIADLDGVPHLYESRFGDVGTADQDTYLLSPVPDDALALALESWAIWRRWEIAFHNGLTTSDTHPALPEDRPRHVQLEQELNFRLVLDESRAFCATATFRVREQDSYEPGIRSLEVEWTVVSCGDYKDNRPSIDPY